eukprot:g2468.t1
MAPEEEARFGFGFAAKSKGAMIPEPKRRRKTTAPQAPPATAGNTSKPDGGDKGQPSTMKTDKVSKASDRLDALSKFTAQALWQGSVKEKDVESKLQKSLGISAEILEASDMNEEARKTAETLEASATTISDQVDTFKILRTAVEKICKLACERFELLADQFAKEHLLALLRSGGAKSALDFVQTQKIQPSPGLQMSIDVLKQGQLLEELTALVENYEPTAQDDKDFSRITQAIKSMLTVSSLSIEDVKHFYPDVPEKIQKFQAFVEKDMTQLFQSAMACIKKGSTLVEKGDVLRRSATSSRSAEEVVGQVSEAGLYERAEQGSSGRHQASQRAGPGAEVTVKHSCEEGSLGLLGADVFAQDIPKDKAPLSQPVMEHSDPGVPEGAAQRVLLAGELGRAASAVQKVQTRLAKIHFCLKQIEVSIGGQLTAKHWWAASVCNVRDVWV